MQLAPSPWLITPDATLVALKGKLVRGTIDAMAL